MTRHSQCNHRLLGGIVAVALAALLPASLGARATVTLENPGERSATLGLPFLLDLRVGVQGEPQGELTATVSAPLASASVVDVPEGIPPASVTVKKVRLKGVPTATGAFAVTVSILDAGVPQASVTFTLRVSEWRVGDLFVGVSTNPFGSPPGGVMGQYRVMRAEPGAGGMQDLGTVVIPSTGQEFLFPGLAYGCAVDPYSGLLYTTDFDTRVNVVDSVPDHGLLRSLTTARVPTRAPAPGADPPTEDWNYISWQPESITFGTDRRFLVGHVGGLVSGWTDDAQLVPPSTAADCGVPIDLLPPSQGWCPWELPIADDGLSQVPNKKLWPLASRDPAERYNLQLVAPYGTQTEQKVPNQPWYYLLDFNDPQNPITDAPCLLDGSCPAPDSANPRLITPQNWGPATPRRLSITALNAGPGYEVVEIDPWGFLRSIDPSRAQPRLPVIQVVNGEPNRVPARRWWGKDLHRFDSKAPDQSAVEATAEYFETRYGSIGTDWIDLASDQRHVYYTSETNAIHVYDLGDPGDPLASPPIPPTPPHQEAPYAAAVPGAAQLYALRLLPPGDGSGGILVAGSPSVFLVKPEPPVTLPDGSTRTTMKVVRTYDVAGGGLDDDGFFGLSISPDAKTFWTASQTTGKVYQFRIADAERLQTVDMSTRIDMTERGVRGLCMKLEYTAAREPCNGIDDDADGVVDNNCLPVVMNDVATTPEDTSVRIDVVANDHEPDGDPLTPKIVTQPAHGTAVVEFDPLPGGGQKPWVRYAPNADYNGGDSFTYKASEGVSESANVATVTITVVPVNDPPVAVDDAHSTSLNQTLTRPAPGVLGNDTDVDRDTLSASVATGPAHGTLVLNGTGSFTYKPAGDPGTDSFTYRVFDGTAYSAPATVTITVLPNAAPDCTVATARPATIWPPNHKLVRISIGGVTDPDGDTLTPKITSIRQDEPTNTDGDGSRTPDGTGVGTSRASVRAERSGTKKTPGNGRVYDITFTADDGHGGTCTGEVRVCVPGDQGSKKSSCVDEGALYDSTVTWPRLPSHDEDHCSVPDHDHRRSQRGKGNDDGPGGKK